MGQVVCEANAEPDGEVHGVGACDTKGPLQTSFSGCQFACDTKSDVLGVVITSKVTSFSEMVFDIGSALIGAGSARIDSSVLELAQPMGGNTRKAPLRSCVIPYEAVFAQKKGKLRNTSATP